MKLSSLLKGVDVIQKVNYANVNIASLAIKDKDCEKGSLFFAVSGHTFDGVMFANNSVQKGAKCIVTSCVIDGIDAVQIVVSDVRVAMSVIASNFYDNAHKYLDIIAVVGTNGKTTTSSILYNLLKDSGKKVGLIGTLGVKINDINLPNDMTTPDPIELHYLFHQMLSFGVEVVVMEVSAHAIALQKMHGIKCKYGIFTNISKEHLDFFGNLKNYADIKLGYFNSQNMEMAIVNVDDEYGKQLVLDKCLPLVTYGLSNPADTFAIDIKMSIKSCSFIVNTFDEVFKVCSCFVGDYNVYNLMAVITTAKLFGIKSHQIVTSLKRMKCIEGRLEVFNFAKGNKVIVDFAHTSEGFNKVLALVKTLRPHGKIITLFGCVGYSDKQKREDMGRIASKYSDKVILTQDNPDFVRFEDICADIKITCDCIKIPDRVSAVKHGIEMLNENDTLVCLGKGGEKKQKINGVNFAYNELEVVKNLSKRQMK